VNCPHSADPARPCTACAFKLLQDKRPDLIDRLSGFGSRQMAILEALATCDHEGAPMNLGVRCEGCGAEVRSTPHRRRVWVPTILGRHAKELLREMKEDILRGLGETRPT
jgi:hypothetical protein